MTAQIRPRNNHEAIDLGFVMVRHWWRALFSLWFIITLPVILLLNLGLPDSPYLAIILFWWLKPLWETTLLHYIAEQLFSNNISIRPLLKKLPSLLWHQLFSKLLIRRLSLTRSFDMPVGELEKLTGVPRNKRLNILHRTTSSTSIGLTSIAMSIENTLIFAFIGLVWLFIPPEFTPSINPFEWINSPSLHLALCWGWYFSMSLVAPFYVAAGFSLYINRRTVLEGWDIELAFKEMANRHASRKTKTTKPNTTTNLVQVAMALISACLISFSTPNIAHATETVTSKPLIEPITQLTPHQSQQLIIEVMESDTFNNIQTGETWRLDVNWFDWDEKPDDDQSDFLKALEGFFNILAQSIEVILWGVAISLVIFLLVRFGKIDLPAFIKPKPKSTHVPPSSLFGLDLNHDSVPDDPAAIARQHWNAGNKRQAYSLLYRSALYDLLHNEKIALDKSHTEGECVLLFQKQHNAAKSQFFSSLTTQWIQLAYGHDIPDERLFETICSHWATHFNGEAST